jgi:hypothetical protein
MLSVSLLFFLVLVVFFREYKFWLLVLVDLVVSLNFPSYPFLFVFLVDFAVDTAVYLTSVRPVLCERYSSRCWFYQPVYDAFVYLAHYLLELSLLCHFHRAQRLIGYESKWMISFGLWCMPIVYDLEINWIVRSWWWLFNPSVYAT